ncbi:MAG: hypothetical protein V5A68_05595 [Candidatus Thermoplasmatota archaeon]
MKKIIPILISLIIIFIPSNLDNQVGSIKNNYENTIKENIYQIKNITPKDDAFHHKKNIFTQEWWYFDAVFDKEYDIHIGIKVITVGKISFVRQLINIYKNNEIYEKKYVTKPINQFQISEKYPNIKYKNKDIMKFDQEEYNKTGRWKYYLNIDLGIIKANLTFIGKSKGFTYTTSEEGWTVAQPKAKVKGTIFLNDEIKKINGTGYHDHNWGFSLKTSIRGKGWFWGKVQSNNYSLTWAKIIKTTFADNTLPEKLAVLSTLNDDFIKINPENIKFTAKKYRYRNGRFIPTNFSFYTSQENVEIKVNFNAISIERTEPTFFTIHYWRYFISMNGYIRVGNKVDRLKDSFQIMEYLRFI